MTESMLNAMTYGNLSLQAISLLFSVSSSSGIALLVGWESTVLKKVAHYLGHATVCKQNEYSSRLRDRLDVPTVDR